MRGFSPIAPDPSPPPVARAFTLIELLVVMALIGLITFIAIPAFRGFGQENIIAAARRQVQDDLGFARLQAIKNRSPVYMVFFQPPFEDSDRFTRDLSALHDELLNLPATPTDSLLRETALRVYTNTFPNQFACYALYTESSVGEQPGVRRRRFLTEWRPLPEGALFPTNGLQLRLPAFITGISNRVVLTNLATRPFPFPIALENLDPRNQPRSLNLPAIAFDSQGRLYSFDEDGLPKGNGTTLNDRFVAVGVGSISFTRRSTPGRTNQYEFNVPPDLIETPRYNYTNHIVRVSALTGRAKYQKPPQP